MSGHGLCPVCRRAGCALDCSDAPWNWGKHMGQRPFTYMVRFQRWRRSVSENIGPMTLSDIRWVNGTRLFTFSHPNDLV